MEISYMPNPRAAYSGTQSWLIVGGVVLALAGLAALAVPALIVGVYLMAPRGVVALSPRDLSLSTSTYGLIGVSLLSVAYGSIRCRRWARPWALIVCKCWLLCGLVALAGAILSVEALRQQAGGAGSAQAVGLVIGLAFLLVLLILLPTGLLFIYWPARTREALNVLDPTTRWTDRIATPVLGLGVGCLLCAAFILVALTHRTTPFFNVLIERPWNWLWIGSSSVAWTWAGVQILRQRASGWMLSLILTVISCGTYAVSGASGATARWIEQNMSHLPPEQIEMIKHTSVGPAAQVLISGVILAISVAYIGWCRKFFGKIVNPRIEEP